jgi:DNA polymerase bacteriophage-type
MIHADFETFSEADLIRVGSHRYAADKTTEALCVGVSLGPDDPPRVVDLHGNPRNPQLEPMFERVRQGEGIVAHNAEFERSIWAMMTSRHGWPKAKRSQFHCTAARSVAAGFPRSLDASAARVGLTVSKDPRGKDLLKMFAMLQRNGSRIRPGDNPEAYTQLLAYCQQDVVVESALDIRLPQLHPFERSAFLLDSLINDRGFPIDLGLVNKALDAVEILTDAANKRVEELTGGIRPTQRNAMLAWLKEEGAAIDTLQAQEIKDLIAGGTLTPELTEVLGLRMEASRAGLAKLAAMRDGVCPDGKIHGGVLYYGAHTGRWTGVKVQPHNFARGDPKEQDRLLDLLDRGGAELLQLFYGNPLVALSESMRGFIATPPGSRWVIADYAAIEARVLAWLANEMSMLERYRQGVDLYKWMAAMLYQVAERDVTKEQRRVGKNTILGCGYSMGPPTFQRYLADAGVYVSLEFAQHAVGLYRNMVPNIVRYWKLVEDSVKHAIRNRGVSYPLGPLRFLADSHALYIYLPSGRPIVYRDPYLREEQTIYGPRDVIGFWTTFKGRWVSEHTYGGKLVENIVQGASRDIMVEGMLNGERAGYPVSLTVHDEIGAPMPDGQGSAEEFEHIITKLPEWGTGLPLGAEGFEGRRYRKN